MIRAAVWLADTVMNALVALFCPYRAGEVPAEWRDQ
jgi:hypothetical protein